MHLTRYIDPARFLADTSDFLIKSEAAHNLFFGIINTLITHPEAYPGDNYMATISQGGVLVGCAYRTPPYNLVLSRFEDPGAAGLIAEDYATRGDVLPAILGSPESAQPFMTAWSRLRGVNGRTKERQRIFELIEVIWPEFVAGQMRVAQAADRELVVEWSAMFRSVTDEEPEMEEEATSQANRIERGLASGAFVLWEVDGVPVSMAASGGPTPNGIRVSYVFTPPEYRRHGYASALVAALSQRLLDEGRTRCFLFTDLDNPTSNHIYQEVGYRAVCDMNVYRFA